MEKQYEIAIIGGGPAGLSAAMSARVRNKSVVIFESYGFSDKLQKAHLISNYPGMPKKSGKEIMEVQLSQAKELGTDFIMEKVQMVYPGETFMISTTQNHFYSAQSIIIATGTAPAVLYPGEEELLGKGVSYCATCDGMIYKGQEVAVFGLEPEAPHEAEFLAEICSKVHYFPLWETSHNFTQENIIVHDRKNAPKEILGADLVSGFTLTDGTEISATGIFILRQATRLDTFLHGLEVAEGSILADKQQRTNIPGVFAAGDCTGKPWQLPRAVGEGNVAALAAVDYLNSKK